MMKWRTLHDAVEDSGTHIINVPRAGRHDRNSSGKAGTCTPQRHRGYCGVNRMSRTSVVWRCNYRKPITSVPWNSPLTQHTQNNWMQETVLSIRCQETTTHGFGWFM